MCSMFVLALWRRTLECPTPLKPLSLPLIAADWSRRDARRPFAKVSRQRSTVSSRSRTRTLVAVGLKMAPQGSENADSAPGNGMASAASDPLHVVEGVAERLARARAGPLTIKRTLAAAWKSRRKRLNTFNPRLKVVWPRKTRIHTIWYGWALVISPTMSRLSSFAFGERRQHYPREPTRHWAPSGHKEDSDAQDDDCTRRCGGSFRRRGSGAD
jgi:hypothetical protein